MADSAVLTDTDGFQELLYADGMARIAAAADPPTFSTLTSFLAYPIATQRKIAVRGGESHDAFVVARMEGTVELDLQVPSRGGQWWWLVQERNWSGLGSVTLRLLKANASAAGYRPYLDESSTPPGLVYRPGALVHTVVYAVWVTADNTDVLLFDRRRFRRPEDQLPVPEHKLHLTSTGASVGVRPNHFGGVNENILNVEQYSGRAREFFETTRSVAASPFYRIRVTQSIRVRFDFRISGMPLRGGDQGSIGMMVVRNWDREGDDPHSPLIVVEDEQPGENGHRLWLSGSMETNAQVGETFGLCFKVIGLTNAGGILIGNSQGRSEPSPYTCYYDATYVGNHR